MPDLSYQQWLNKYNITPTPDYNTHDAWMAGLTPDARGHLPDTFKLPNHITYSDESVYSKVPGAPEPGKWRQENKQWVFYASPTNIQNAGGRQDLVNYFKKYEPDSLLVLPDNSFTKSLVK
jgi:hypothetical protein